MDKQRLQPGQDYAYRVNVRAWVKAEDPPARATLVESLGGGKHRLRLESGDEIEARSSQLVARWDRDKIAALLRREARSRAFAAETIRDERVAEAVSLVLTTLSRDTYVSSDRAWIPAADAEKVTEAAEVQAALLDLSPVAHLDEGEDAVILPLPVAADLARRIAERSPDAVARAVEADKNDLLSRGYLALAPRYKPGWDKALGWAGHAPVALPEPEASPADAYKRLWERLRGMGVPTIASEAHAWKVDEARLMEVGPLLAGAARHSGRVTLRPMAEGYVRLALESGYRSPASTPEQIRDLALSLSRQQQAALWELREAGTQGISLAAMAAHPRTAESLVSWGLAEQVDVDADHDHSSWELRIRLTDAGWRVLQHLGPRAAEW